MKLMFYKLIKRFNKGTFVSYVVSLVLFAALCLFFIQSFPAGAQAATSLNTGSCSSGLDKSQCGITNVLVAAIRVLSGLVGVVVVAMIIIGGIQYAAARDNPQAVAAAKQKIINAVLALVFYFCIFGFLQWLVPGGIV